MNVVSILSSHYPGSFVQKLQHAFQEALIDQGHESDVIDLYADDFNPVMRGDDFKQFSGGSLPEDVLAYQERLRSASCLAFFYPVWWNDMPAIMKGFIDRVFSKGFAYDYTKEKGPFGLLDIRKVILVCSLGNTRDSVPRELEHAMRTKERVGVFEYSGVPEVEHVFFYSAERDPLAETKAIDKVRSLAEIL